MVKKISSSARRGCAPAVAGLGVHSTVTPNRRGTAPASTWAGAHYSGECGMLCEDQNFLTSLYESVI
jgi:hypothetical protein